MHKPVKWADEKKVELEASGTSYMCFEQLLHIDIVTESCDSKYFFNR